MYAHDLNITFSTSKELAKDYISIGIVILGVLIIGIIITSISTFFATQRFLNLKTDDLY